MSTFTPTWAIQRVLQDMRCDPVDEMSRKAKYTDIHRWLLPPPLPLNSTAFELAITCYKVNFDFFFYSNDI